MSAYTFVTGSLFNSGFWKIKNSVFCHVNVAVSHIFISTQQINHFSKVLSFFGLFDDCVVEFDVKVIFVVGLRD